MTSPGLGALSGSKKDGFIASGLAESRPGFSDTATAARLCGPPRWLPRASFFVYIFDGILLWHLWKTPQVVETG